MQNYDLVISLGSKCRTAGTLKGLKITQKTYPFDWVRYDGNITQMNLLTRCNLIKNHFEGAFNIEDFVEYHNPYNSHKRSTINIKTQLYFGHEFSWDKSVKDSFPEFLEKYQRRIKRLYEDVENANNVLFVFDSQSKSTSLTTIREAIAILKESFTNKNINLLVLLPLLSADSPCYQELKTNIDNVIILLCPVLDAEYDIEVLNLIKYLGQFFGKQYFSFSRNEDIICSGLSGTESFGRWSDGDMCFFRLPTMSKQPTLSVDINVTPFVCTARQNQKCRIICNGRDIKEMVITRPQTINLTLSNDNNGNLDFIFEFDNTQSPKELGLSEDTRKLALGFIDAIISENA